MKWVTRQSIRVNRAATAWVIRRFVDADATFHFVTADEVAAVQQREGAIGFDAPGATYPHRDAQGRCSFEALVQEYRPNDPALQEMARIVRGADFPEELGLTPESAGLRCISQGFPLVAQDDTETVEKAAFLYDALYAALRRKQTVSFPGEDGRKPMADSPLKPVSRLRLAMLLWLASMVGAVSLTVLVMPQISAVLPLPAPSWLIVLASAGQSGVLLALATWAGLALTPAVGFRAPLFEAAAGRRPIRTELWSQVRPGLSAGVPAGFALFLFTRFAPTEIARLSERFEPPLLARLLYGGITEEVLLRWGLMTSFTWVMWRLLQRPGEAVRPASVSIAIVASSLVFGLGHLPAAHLLLGGLTPSTVTWVIGANTSFGLLFGWLFWRRGLESAIVAHAMTHLVSSLVGLL